MVPTVCFADNMPNARSLEHVQGNSRKLTERSAEGVRICLGWHASTCPRAANSIPDTILFRLWWSPYPRKTVPQTLWGVCSI